MGKIMYMDEPYSSTFENATSVKYSNTKSQIAATNAQDAIDELVDNQYKTNVNLAQLSKPNLLINADFQVWQRGESLETTKVNAFGYSADRWCYYASETKTIKKVDNGVYTEANLNQFLENKLKSGEPYVLSAMIDGEIHTLNIVGGVENENLRLRYAIGTSYDRIEILLRQGQESGEISSATISWVKLEVGTLRTPFVPRLYGEELLLCQRYYYVLPYAQYTINSGGTGNCYLHSEWVRNHMRGSKTVLSTLTSVRVGSNNAYNQYNITLMSYDEDAIYIRLPTLENTNRYKSLYMWYPNKTDKIVVDAEIY